MFLEWNKAINKIVGYSTVRICYDFWGVEAAPSPLPHSTPEKSHVEMKLGFTQRRPVWATRYGQCSLLYCSPYVET